MMLPVCSLLLGLCSQLNLLFLGHRLSKSPAQQGLEVAVFCSTAAACSWIIASSQRGGQQRLQSLCAPDQKCSVLAATRC